MRCCQGEQAAPLSDHNGGGAMLAIQCGVGDEQDPDAWWAAPGVERSHDVIARSPDGEG